MAVRTLEEILLDLRERMDRLERRRPGGGSRGGSASPLGVMQWGAKAGPSAWVSAYKNSWFRGEDSGGSLDAKTNPNGIVVKATGIYEVHAHQRGGSATDYLGIALDGDRTTLEFRAGGVWTHDHSSGGNGFGNSCYMAPFSLGEVMTAGGPVAGANLFVGATTAGSLYVRRIA